MAEESDKVKNLVEPAHAAANTEETARPASELNELVARFKVRSS